MSETHPSSDIPSSASFHPLWKKRWAQNVLMLMLGAIGVYGLVYWDVVNRARESFQEAEKYMEWYRQPEKKKDFFESTFQKDKANLDQLLQKNKITQDDYRKRLDVLEFDKNFALQESSLKYAYEWYKDTYELFSPPESTWVRRAREEAPKTLELWKQELRRQNVPFVDTMFQ